MGKIGSTIGGAFVGAFMGAIAGTFTGGVGLLMYGAASPMLDTVGIEHQDIQKVNGKEVLGKFETAGYTLGMLLGAAGGYTAAHHETEERKRKKELTMEH